MAKVPLIMPEMGEAILKAKIMKWIVPVGGRVDQGTPILEISTDKVDADVPSLVQGVLIEVLFKVGAVVNVGTVIAFIETEAAANPGTPAANASQAARPIKQSFPTQIG